MNRKYVKILSLVCVLFVLFASSCKGRDATVELVDDGKNANQRTPEPDLDDFVTPPDDNPEGWAKIAGTDLPCVSVCCSGEETSDWLFVSGVIHELSLMGIDDVREYYGTVDPDGHSDLVFVKDSGFTASGIADAYVSEEDCDILRLVFDSCISYPNHDTPVRTLGCFSSEDSPAAVLYQQYIEEGKFLDKGADYSGGSLQSFMSSKLSRYYPGMLDGIICETDDMAVEVLGILKREQRNDFEVFSCEPFPALAESMSSDPDMTAGTVGISDYLAGRMLVILAVESMGNGRKTGSVSPSFTLPDDEGRYYEEYFAALTDEEITGLEGDNSVYLKEYYR